MKLIHRKYHLIYGLMVVFLVIPIFILGSFEQILAQVFVLLIQLFALVAYGILTFSTKEF